MTETLQIAGLPGQGVPKQTAAAALTALGVVYGDIGTSTLYGLKQAVEAAGAPTPDTVMGIVSLILWALLLIVGLKYAILTPRAVFPRQLLWRKKKVPGKPLVLDLKRKTAG